MSAAEHSAPLPRATVLVIAHRGASWYAPEHTTAAYDLALDAGADYIEQDLQLTADGELIVLHDETLERTTGGALTGRVGAMPFADLAECDVGSWFNRQRPERARPEFASLHIPRLADVFDRYAGRARFYIETKNPADAPGMEEKLVALLEQYGLKPAVSPAPSLRHTATPPTVILQSFSSDSLKLLARLAPAIPRVRLIDSAVSAADIIRQLDAISEYAGGIGPAYSSVDAPLVDAAHRVGLAVHPYTVNDEHVMRRLIAARVDAMFTDDPALLLRVRPATSEL